LIEAAKIVLLVLSVLVLVGGIIGFVKAKSKASIIAGVISAILLGGSYVYSLTDAKRGLIAGDVVCLLLAIMFRVRWRISKKFMPSGMLAILMVLSLAFITYVVELMSKS